MTPITKSVDNLVTGQPLQPRGVRRPVLLGVGGDTTVVVEVYALGCGVSLVRERPDLLGRQGAFELEPDGGFFVFDPLGAIHADGFVSSVKGDVAAVALAVQTVDQKDLAKLGHGVSHTGAPCKTAILALPQGMGKSRAAAVLVLRLGCTSIVDEWNQSQPITPGALHLTNGAVRMELPA